MTKVKTEAVTLGTVTCEAFNKPTRIYNGYPAKAEANDAKCGTTVLFTEPFPRDSV